MALRSPLGPAAPALALALFLTVGPAEAQDVDRLVADLATENADDARSTLVALGKPAVTALAVALPAAATEHGWQILRVLRAMGPDASSGKARLQGLAKDVKAPAELRAMACLALSSQGSKAASAAEVLFDACEHPDARLRVAAILALGELGESAAKKLVKPAVGEDLFTGILAQSALLLTGEASRVAVKPLQELCTNYAMGSDEDHIYVLQRMAPLLLQRLAVEFVDPELFAQGLDDTIVPLGPGGQSYELGGWKMTSRRLRGGTLDVALLSDSAGLWPVLIDAFELAEGHPARAAVLPAQLFDWNEDGKLTTGEALASLAHHLPLQIEQLARELSTELPASHAGWEERTQGIAGLLELLWLWSRPEFLDRSLCLRSLPFEGPGFDPPKVVRELVGEVERKR